MALLSTQHTLLLCFAARNLCPITASDTLTVITREDACLPAEATATSAYDHQPHGCHAAAQKVPQVAQSAWM
ncbi:hypothetical protein FKP32DRAFT_1664984 [Trametes sanguinea]|nr:hypothetical protein FKP32DRAFT_1664984 [Trametes sanguinea]